MVAGHRAPERETGWAQNVNGADNVQPVFNLQACKLAESPTVVPLKKGHIYQHRSTAS